jgi:hypothetical protein
MNKVQKVCRSNLRLMFKNSVTNYGKENNTSSFTKIRWLVLLRELIAVYYENHLKYINTLCGQNAKFCIVKWCTQLPVGFKQLKS